MNTSTAEPIDAEANAVDRMNDWLRDFAGFDAMQIHFVHEAIEQAGLVLKMPSEAPQACNPSRLQFWVVVWMPSGKPVVPHDCNPESDDEGMLVYGSKNAAQSSASHQMELWGDKETAVAIPLSQIGMTIVTDSLLGPQKQPSSVAKVQAEARQAEKEME